MMDADPELVVHNTRAEPPGLPRGSGPAIGFTVAVAVSLVVVAAGGTRHHTAALAAYAVVTAAVAAFTAMTEGVAVAGTAWLFMNGFVVNRSGELRWDGTADLTRVLVLDAAALAARGVFVVVHARMSRAVAPHGLSHNAGSNRAVDATDTEPAYGSRELPARHGIRALS